MPRTHTYTLATDWTGNTGQGTASYTAYGREYRATSGSKPPIFGSSDPAFRGNGLRWSPEDLLVAALSSCHQLWYLHMCADNGICVLDYHDDATGTMVEGRNERGHFTRVQLRPRVTIREDGDTAKAEALHQAAHEACFIANSVNFTVDVSPVILTAPAPAAPGVELRAP